MQNKNRSEGIAVIDTSSLYAASQYLQEMVGLESYIDSTYDRWGSDRRNIKKRIESRLNSFLMVLHNLLLYKEIRTDFDVLSIESEFYRDNIEYLTRLLSGTVEVRPMPVTITDEEIALSIMPIFRKNIRISEFNETEETFYESYLQSRLFRTQKSLEKFVNLFSLKNRGEESRRQLMIAARTLRYSAHSKFIQSTEGIASAFCASPSRIDVLKDYLDPNSFNRSKNVHNKSVDLFSKLGLPESGYDFTGFVTKPLTLSDLSRYIKHLHPRAALELVLKLRETDEGQLIRETWAERLWSAGPHAIEGLSAREPTINASMENITAHQGDIYQIIAVTSGAKFENSQQPTLNVVEAKSYIIDKLKNMGR